MKNYETIFILSPLLSNEQISVSIEKYRSFLLTHHATIVHEEAIGLRSLAYPISHKKSGVYHLIEFASAPELIQELEVTYSRDEAVLRFLTFALDKYALAHNAARRLAETQKEVQK